MKLEPRGAIAIPLLSNLLCAGLLIVLAVAPDIGGPDTGIPDDVWHAVAYGAQAGLLWWAMSPWLLSLGAAAAAWIGATGLGVLTELLQRLQPARAVELTDVVADAVGAAAVVVACLAVRRIMAVVGNRSSMYADNGGPAT